MARQAKFEFEEERKLVQNSRTKKGSGYTVSINGKHGYMSFSLDYIRDKGLNGKFIKLYADISKKTIGWRILEETDLAELHGYRKLRVQQVKSKKGYESKYCKLTIKPLLKLVGAKEQSYIGLPIEKYHAPTIMSHDLQYVTLI